MVAPTSLMIAGGSVPPETDAQYRHRPQSGFAHPFQSVDANDRPGDRAFRLAPRGCLFTSDSNRIHTAFSDFSSATVDPNVDEPIFRFFIKMEMVGATLAIPVLFFATKHPEVFTADF